MSSLFYDRYVTKDLFNKMFIIDVTTIIHDGCLILYLVDHLESL